MKMYNVMTWILLCQILLFYSVCFHGSVSFSVSEVSLQPFFANISIYLLSHRQASLPMKIFICPGIESCLD